METVIGFDNHLYQEKFIKNILILDASMKAITKKYGKVISPGNSLWASHFTNCREQGYHISNGYHAVSFSEDRSSDAIVVYYGTNSQFCHVHHTPKTDEDWGRSKYFGHTVSIETIADFISDHIVEGMLAWDEILDK